MSSRTSWLCDGVSKNSKQYPGVYRPHKPYENYGSHCQICGKPREAMIPNHFVKRLLQPTVLSGNAVNLPRRATSPKIWQLLLVLGIPTISVIFALYFMLNPILKSRIELSQSYESPNYGIKIKYPDKWEIQDKQDPTFTGDLAILLPPQKTTDDCQAALTIAVDNLAENPPSIEEYKNSIMQKITTLNPNTKIADQSASAMLSNSSAYKLAYTRQEHKCSLQVMEIGTIRHNQAYYITYKASQNMYNNFLKPVEAMINSFEIKEVNH